MEIMNELINEAFILSILLISTWLLFVPWTFFMFNFKYISLFGFNWALVKFIWSETIEEFDSKVHIKTKTVYNM